MRRTRAGPSMRRWSIAGAMVHRGLKALAAVIVCAAGPIASAQAVERVAAVYGQGNSVDVYGIEIGSADWRRWELGGSWRASAYGTASIGYWRAREHTDYK